ncbi:MAG: hypothetical protein WDW36_008102 [Sanguina aurantia]
MRTSLLVTTISSCRSVVTGVIAASGSVGDPVVETCAEEALDCRGVVMMHCQHGPPPTPQPLPQVWDEPRTPPHALGRLTQPDDAQRRATLAGAGEPVAVLVHSSGKRPGSTVTLAPFLCVRPRIKLHLSSDSLLRPCPPACLRNATPVPCMVRERPAMHPGACDARRSASTLAPHVHARP